MRALGRPSASPLSAPIVALGALRHISRRYRLGRVAGLTITAIVMLVVVQRAEATRAAAQAQWTATTMVWITSDPIAAGDVITPAMVIERTVPSGLVPADAVTMSPLGSRVRVDLGAGEIVVGQRLADAASPFAARTPQGWGAVSLGNGDALFQVGDRLDLYHLVDGHRLTQGALIVAVTDGDLGVAIHPDNIGAVVRALGQAGVVPVLTG